MEANQLIEKIKSTNNGYLFAPTGMDLRIANSNPEIFRVISTGNADFPNKIFLK